MANTPENKQLENAVAPVVAFNKLVIKNAEEAFNMQIASLQTYTKMSLENLNAGLDVRDPDEFKAYAEKQKDMAKEFTDQMAADAKAFGELNARFLEEARTLTEASIKAAAETDQDA